MYVPAGGQYVYRQGNYQQARRADVRSLKAPVARPKPPADCAAGRHRKKEQREQGQDAGALITRRGELDMLDHPVIGAEQ